MCEKFSVSQVAIEWPLLLKTEMLQTQMAGEAEISGLPTDEAVMDLVAGIRAESET